MAEASAPVLSGLRDLVRATRRMSGRPFLEQITIGLSRLLGGAYVQVGRLSPDSRTIRADPSAHQGKPLQPIEYDLANTPCAHVVGATTRHHPEGVADLFPEDAFLREQGYVGYLGCPMFSSTGEPSGLLSVLSTAPLRLDGAEIALLEALASRAGADAERVQALADRAASHALFREIVDQQAEMVCRFSKDGRLTFANRAYLTTFGISTEEVGTKSYVPRLHPDDREHVHSELAKISPENPRVVIENRIFGAHDQVLWTQWTNIGLFDDAGNVTGFQSAGRDITANKLAEERLHQLYDELNQAHEQKDQFLAVLAHELRNPLGVIVNAIGVLERAPQRGPAEQRALSIAKRQALHQSRLLDDLLDLSRITRGKVNLRKADVSLFRVAAEAVDARRAVFEGKSQHVELKLPAHEVYVHADKDRLEQIIANLLSNAFKFTPAGGRIVLEGEVADAVATLRITDSGVGIAPDMLEKVFDPFHQGTQSHATRTGLGLGLTVVRELVQRHGGTITAESRGVGTGSTFTVRLPTSSPQPSERESRVAAASAREPRRVLVVDDNVDGAEMLAELLSFWGHDVTAVNDGETAVRTARQTRPSVALVDIEMPGLDGYATARRLRAEHGRTDMLLVAVTGYGQASDVEKARAAGFDEHLTKPVNHEALRALIDSLDAEPSRQAP